jgi:hypothetical protein
VAKYPNDFNDKIPALQSLLDDL